MYCCSPPHTGRRKFGNFIHVVIVHLQSCRSFLLPQTQMSLISSGADECYKLFFCLEVGKWEMPPCKYDVLLFIVMFISKHDVHIGFLHQRFIDPCLAPCLAQNNDYWTRTLALTSLCVLRITITFEVGAHGGSIVMWHLLLQMGCILKCSIHFESVH